MVFFAIDRLPIVAVCIQLPLILCLCVFSLFNTVSTHFFSLSFFPSHTHFHTAVKNDIHVKFKCKVSGCHLWRPFCGWKSADLLLSNVSDVAKITVWHAILMNSFPNVCSGCSLICRLLGRQPPKRRVWAAVEQVWLERSNASQLFKKTAFTRACRCAQLAKSRQFLAKRKIVFFYLHTHTHTQGLI